jgi:hypothetical protein
MASLLRRGRFADEIMQMSTNEKVAFARGEAKSSQYV